MIYSENFPIFFALCGMTENHFEWNEPYNGLQ